LLLKRGGKICIDIHFAPLWQKNAPKLGIVHALALAVIFLFILVIYLFTIS